MFRLTPLLLAALLLVPVPVVGQAGTIDRRTYLTVRAAPAGTGLEVDNYRDLHYIVEDLPDSIQSTGLTKERIATRVELRMRSAGLAPTETEASFNPFLFVNPFLYVNINGARNAFSIALDLNRQVNFYLDDPSSDRYLVRRVYAATWSTGSTGTHSGSSALLLESLDSKLDQFLNAYLAANQE